MTHCDYNLCLSHPVSEGMEEEEYVTFVCFKTVVYSFVILHVFQMGI